jgi:hypothetical protein
LDFDGWGHVHALDNFNPSLKDIDHRKNLGILYKYVLCFSYNFSQK